MPEPKRSLSVSPLLSDDVIVRDYTKGIETQLSGGKPKIEPYKAPEQQQQHAPKPEPKPDPAPSQAAFNHPSDFTEPAGFQFQEDVDPSDVTGDEPAGDMNIASGSAKGFANVIGDMIKIKVPEIAYPFIKVDMGSIEAHIANGNMHPSMRDVFTQVNEQSLAAIGFSDDEIKMWKKAFKEYLEYKNIAAANPETAFWIATGVLALSFGIKFNQLSKQIKQMLVDSITSYNPGYYDSFAAKQANAKRPEPQSAPAAAQAQPGDTAKAETKTEKATV
jgi:hypothetical protein